MILGYHYHVPVKIVNGKIFIHSYIGVFVIALAKHVDELILFLHEEPDPQASGYDQLLDNSKIRLCNLGLKTPAWDRFLFTDKYIWLMEIEAVNCDALLLRAPSPLAPAIFKHFHNRINTFFLLVGDYAEGMHLIKNQPFIRRQAIKLLLKRNDSQLRKQLSKANTFVNSIALIEKYKSIALNLKHIITSSINESDFYEREDTCRGDIINVLYTGRMDLAKGLVELIIATEIIHKQGINIHTHLVAWEDDPSKPIEEKLKKLCTEMGIKNLIHFHGKKNVGEELNNMYRESDIYAIPSYFEGFPRTIWEALANSVPVVSTPVGGIPFILEDKKNVVFTDIRNSTDLSEKIKLLIFDEGLRKGLIYNGFIRAKEATQNVQCGKIISLIEKNFN
jgi:glycosyltransferase involved in cell wall biosynthesis